MVNETILQNWVVTDFILPFLLVFTIIFAILQKTKVLGEGKKQLDAIVAFVIGLIFVGAVFPKLVVGNLILFLTVSIIVVFVLLLLWGFVSGTSIEKEVFPGKLKWVVFGVVSVAVIIGVLWAVGIQNTFFDFLFRSGWSNDFWTNFFFIAVIVIAMAMVLKNKK